MLNLYDFAFFIATKGLFIAFEAECRRVLIIFLLYDIFAQNSNMEHIIWKGRKRNPIKLYHHLQSSCVSKPLLLCL